MDLNAYPKGDEEDRHFNFLFSKCEWTLSQAVFLAFDKLYVFQDAFEKEYLADASFYFSAVELDGTTPESELYLRAVRCIRGGVLEGKWAEKEYDFRVAPRVFVQWLISQDVRIGFRIDNALELLTSKTFPYKNMIQECAKQFVNACLLIDDNPCLPRAEIISFVKNRLSLPISDKTIENYIGEISSPGKRKKGHPKKCLTQKNLKN